jgi:hypothetical protein
VATDEHLRLGGRLELPTGERIVWSVADGRRGRRWRELATQDGAVVRAVLFETDPVGRVLRLEVATAAGLLTLHPEGHDEVLHGNVAGPDGVRHLTFDRTVLFVVRSPASAAIALGALGRAIGVGGSRPVDLVRVDDRLEPRPETWQVTRLDERTWRLEGPPREAEGAGEGSAEAGVVAEARTVRLDELGLVELPGGVAWPLEPDPT